MIFSFIAIPILYVPGVKSTEFMFSYYFLQIRFQNICLFFVVFCNISLSFPVKYSLCERQLYIYILSGNLAEQFNTMLWLLCES